MCFCKSIKLLRYYVSAKYSQLGYLYFFTLASKEGITQFFFYAVRVISNKTFLQTQVHRQYGTSVNSFFLFILLTKKRRRRSKYSYCQAITSTCLRR